MYCGVLFGEELVEIFWRIVARITVYVMDVIAGKYGVIRVAFVPHEMCAGYYPALSPQAICRRVM